ncbi:MAG: hypothetical protein R3328_00245 [Planococcaceae bacterium]|nr:hypothetical protein [Planococcaceae bacterium]
MPNWCEGILKVRGTKEEVKSFLLGALQPIPDGIFEPVPVEKEVSEDEWELNLSAKNGFHVKGSRRNFIENSIEFYFDTEGEIKVCAIDGYKAAWDIDVEALVNNSKEYNVDLKIYAFERGQEFNRDIEIHKGSIIKNNEITFDNYDWECINPSMGG